MVQNSNKQLIIFMILKMEMEMETTMKLQEDEYVGYFGDNWNVLDFLTVGSCWIVAFGDALRILRPLRTMKNTITGATGSSEANATNSTASDTQGFGITNSQIKNRN